MLSHLATFIHILGELPTQIVQDDKKIELT